MIFCISSQDVCDLLMALTPSSVLGMNGLYQRASLPCFSGQEPDFGMVADGNKIHLVCGALRGAILSSGRSNFLRAIVTTYAR